MLEWQAFGWGCVNFFLPVIYMEQQTGSKLGKEYNKAVYCQPVYLTYMQSTSCEMPGWMNQAGIKIVGEISTSEMQMIPP